MREQTASICEECHMVFDETANFCTRCGARLKKEKTKIYAYFGKKGVTYSIKLPNGMTLNTNGNVTIPFGKGISYTVKGKK